jgi:hypothetical protein
LARRGGHCRALPRIPRRSHHQLYEIRDDQEKWAVDATVVLRRNLAPDWQAVWARHPDPNGYRQLSARPITAL